MGFDFVNIRMLEATGSVSINDTLVSPTLTTATITTPTITTPTITGVITANSTASLTTIVYCSGSAGAGRMHFSSGLLVSKSGA